MRWLVLLALVAAPAAAQDKDLAAAIDPEPVRAAFDTCVAEAWRAGEGFDACDGLGYAHCERLHPNPLTTVGMVECSRVDLELWDGALNAAYGDLMALAKDIDAGREDLPSYVDDLRTAQRAWIAFRDAECNAEYTRFVDGTIRSLTYQGCMLSMTRERAIKLLRDVEP